MFLCSASKKHLDLSEMMRAISTYMYRMKTFSGLYMKEDSFVPTSFKHYLIYGLLNRAFKISSSCDIVKQEIKVIKNILISNGFSCNFINKHIKHFLRKKHSSDNDLPSFGPIRKYCFYACLFVRSIALN